MTKPAIDQATLDRAFVVLEQAAIQGRRCPTSEDGMKPFIVTALALSGQIRSEISARNWRQITILTGPHAGKKTAPNPLPKSTVYIVTDAHGVHRPRRQWQAPTQRKIAYAGRPR